VPEILPRIVALATAVPDHDIHQPFIGWAREQVKDPRDQRLFDRMAARSGIDHRWSVLPQTSAGGSPVSPGGYYDSLPLPSTGERMSSYARLAPDLAMEAIHSLGDDFDPARISHLVVASCTGFVAPGIDQIIARRLGLANTVERSLIGFMGCYAAVTALRTARHIVRSQPEAVVLVVTVELSTLHLQSATTLEPLLAMLHFGDGAAAALVCGVSAGLGLGDGLSLALPDTESLIRWDIGDQGFAMHLSGEVPARIEGLLRGGALDAQVNALGQNPSLAIHGGGRTILDAVEAGLSLEPEALAASRHTLRDYGNMSSSTLMFTLARTMAAKPAKGLALAFGPGLAVEGVRYGWCDA
jgi:alpha-pyrone synthase